MFCIGIEEGSILDVLELDAASNNSVDNVRELRDEAIYSPAVVKKRVYIIDEVHMLSVSAFNALLKILEEPPEHILFVLATTELHKVPATIQSRCQKFSFRRLSPVVIASRLGAIADSEGLSLTPEAAEKLAALADGSMRDGISLLDQCVSKETIDLKCINNTLGLAGQEELTGLIDRIAGRDVISALDILERLYNDGKDMASLLNEIASLFRDLLVFKLSPESGLLTNAGVDKTTLSGLLKNLTPERLFFCLDVIKTTISGTSRSGSSRLTVELCLIKMCDERLSDYSVALLSRITSLETGSPILTAPVNITSASEKESLTDTVNSIEPQALKAEENMTKGTVSPLEPSLCHIWDGVLENLKSEPSVRVLLSDSSKVQAVFEDKLLTVNFTDSFTANQVRQNFSELIKDAAREILGHDVVLHIEVVDSIGSDDSKHDKLEYLSAFVSSNFD